MDWPSYKRLCDRPDVFSRWMLEQTVELLSAAGDSALCARLNAAMRQAPLAKPDDHRGGSATDMFQLDLPPDAIRQVLDRVAEAARTGIRTSGTARRGLGGFVEAWEEYRSYAA